VDPGPGGFPRVRVHLTAPGSEIPIFFSLLPFPLFHWIQLTLPAGVAPDPLSFPPLPIPVPLVSELQLATVALAAITPELRNGSGDLLTADAACRLPFARSHTTNALNHAEALFDPALQSQVLTILNRFRIRTPDPAPPGGTPVPELLGLTRSAALSALREAHLIGRFIGPAGARTEVVNQSPGAGTSVDSGSLVLVTMGRLD